MWGHTFKEGVMRIILKLLAKVIVGKDNQNGELTDEECIKRYSKIDGDMIRW